MKSKMNEIEIFLTSNIKFLESYIADGEGNDDVSEHLEDLKQILKMLND